MGYRLVILILVVSALLLNRHDIKMASIKSCRAGWQHAALRYNVLNQQTPEQIIKDGKEHCEWWVR